MSAQLRGGTRGTGEPDHVLPAQVIEDALGAPGEQLHRTLRQETGLDDAAEHQLGEVCRLAGGFDHRRDAGQERWGELFQHAPHREVERVDLHGHTAPRGVEVLAEEAPASPDRLSVAVEVDRVVGQLTGSLARVAEQGAEPTVDVDGRVSGSGAGGGRVRVELVFARHQQLAQCLELAGALVEGQLAQHRAADAACVVQHGRHVDTRAGNPRNLLAGDRAV